MFRLIALYIHYRNLQEERTRVGVHAAPPMMRVVPTEVPQADELSMVHTLAA
jgi:hypothetical protein